MIIVWAIVYNKVLKFNFLGLKNFFYHLTFIMKSDKLTVYKELLSLEVEDFDVSTKADKYLDMSSFKMRNSERLKKEFHISIR